MHLISKSVGVFNVPRWWRKFPGAAKANNGVLAISIPESKRLRQCSKNELWILIAELSLTVPGTAVDLNSGWTAAENSAFFLSFILFENDLMNIICMFHYPQTRDYAFIFVREKLSLNLSLHRLATFEHWRRVLAGSPMMLSCGNRITVSPSSAVNHARYCITVSTPQNACVHEMVWTPFLLHKFICVQ